MQPCRYWRIKGSITRESNFKTNNSYTDGGSNNMFQSLYFQNELFYDRGGNFNSVIMLCYRDTLNLQLSPLEIDFLTSHSSAALSAFEKVSDSSASGAKVLAMAGSQIETAKK